MTPSAETLAAALPYVLAAPRDSGPITQLCTRPARGERLFPEHITLTRAAGIPGERWLTDPWLRLPDGRPDPSIQVSILSSRVLDLVWRPSDAAPHPGDPIIADLDLSEANLPVGALIRAGTAVLRVSTVFNTACAKWKVRYGADAYGWITAAGHPPLRLRGFLCAVEEDGAVTLGDRLSVLR